MFVKFGAITCHRMITAKEMSARGNTGNGIEADIVGLAFVIAAEIGDHIDDFHIGNQFFVTDGQPAPPARGMDDNCRAAKQTAPCPELGFIGSLCIIDIGRTTGRPPGHDFPRQLTGGNRCPEMSVCRKAGAPDFISTFEVKVP